MSLLSELAVTGTLRTLQHAVPSAQRSKGGKQGGGGGRPTQAVDDDGDVDMDDAATALDADAGEQAEQVLINLQDVLRKNRLSDNTDALTNVSEAAVALLFTNPTMPGTCVFCMCVLLVCIACVYGVVRLLLCHFLCTCTHIHTHFNTHTPTQTHPTIPTPPPSPTQCQ